jgi:hypothetical protein
VFLIFEFRNFEEPILRKLRLSEDLPVAFSFLPEVRPERPHDGALPGAGRNFEAGRRAERSGKKLKATGKSPNPPRVRGKVSISATPKFKILKKVKLSA